jgi:aspartate 1-decarboxylase
MIINRLKRLVEEYRNNHKKEIALLQELDWANVYHDSIRGKAWLQNLPLNIGRWAGNYTFFYVLNRVLTDCKPNTILEFGLGESSKFISSYLDNYLYQANHLVIEQNANWYHNFTQNFKLSERTEVRICNVVSKNVNGVETMDYENLRETIEGRFDLYVIDGPIGSKHYSRYNIVELAKAFSANDNFIIILDDYHRPGERETVSDLLIVFKEKNIIVHTSVYKGSKNVMVIATDKYKYVCSM